MNKFYQGCGALMGALLICGLSILLHAYAIYLLWPHIIPVIFPTGAVVYSISFKLAFFIALFLGLFRTGIRSK